ncbi:MAG: phosphatidate cytidylyltransferase [Rhodobacteraceae bacterium]|nr:phosphatidate cytidylyltransferase [Paracoccaceae bacterium]
MSAGANWSDLPKRIGVGVIVAGVTFAVMWMGGWLFVGLVALICAVLIWELVSMVESSSNAVPLAALAALILLIAAFVSPPYSLALLAVPSLAGLLRLRANQVLFAIFAVLIMISGYGLLEIRTELGLQFLVWLALVVIATDVMGYFVGRTVGGPKFWPAVSPNKTWSGTIGGWVGAMAIGAFYMFWAGWGPFVLVAGLLTSVASQFGDIAESAVKRRMGVKDSSNLLPGHGGVFDRFDGVLGASLFVIVASAVSDFAPLMAG